MTTEEFGIAFDRGFPRTTKFLASRGINIETAEEVAQAAWVKGWERRHQLRDPGLISPWVNSIALNLFRKQCRRQDSVEIPSDLSVRPATGPDHIDLTRILAKCSHTERELLVKYYAQGYTSTELAKQAGCTATALRVQLLRLRRRIAPTAAKSRIPVAQSSRQAA